MQHQLTTKEVGKQSAAQWTISPTLILYSRGLLLASAVLFFDEHRVAGFDVAPEGVGNIVPIENINSKWQVAFGQLVAQVAKIAFEALRHKGNQIKVRLGACRMFYPRPKCPHRCSGKVFPY